MKLRKMGLIQIIPNDDLLKPRLSFLHPIHAAISHLPVSRISVNSLYFNTDFTVSGNIRTFSKSTTVLDETKFWLIQS